MPTTVNVTAPAAAKKTHPKMVFKSAKPSTRWRVEVPFAPAESSHDGLTPKWVETERDARTPLLLRGGGQLRRVSFALDVAYPDGASIEILLEALVSMSQTIGDDGIFEISGWGGWQSDGLWRITNLGVRVVAREPGSNNATQASVDVTLSEVSDANVTVIALPGNKVPDPKPTAPAPSTKTTTTTTGTGSDTTTTTTTEKWKKGPKPDVVKWFSPSNGTFQSFVGRITGNANDWKACADYNKIAPTEIIGPNARAAIVHFPSDKVKEDTKPKESGGGSGGS